MMTIGELAEAAGTSPRAVRHYHAVGLLPEPARRGNGYREYDARAVLRLLRIRRLRGLGLSLPEIRDALADSEGRELREIVAEMVADLDRQEAALRAQRERLLAVLQRERDLALTPELAGLLADVRRLVPEESLVAREGELLELLEATLPTEQFAAVAERYRAALADPDRVARSLALAARFEALAGAEPDDLEVAAVAVEMAVLGREGFGDLPGAGPRDGDAVYAAWTATLAPAQRACLALVERELAP